MILAQPTLLCLYVRFRNFRKGFWKVSFQKLKVLSFLSSFTSDMVKMFLGFFAVLVPPQHTRVWKKVRLVVQIDGPAQKSWVTWAKCFGGTGFRIPLHFTFMQMCVWLETPFFSWGIELKPKEMFLLPARNFSHPYDKLMQSVQCLWGRGGSHVETIWLSATSQCSLGRMGQACSWSGVSVVIALHIKVFLWTSQTSFQSKMLSLYVRLRAESNMIVCLLTACVKVDPHEHVIEFQSLPPTRTSWVVQDESPLRDVTTSMFDRWELT